MDLFLCNSSTDSLLSDHEVPIYSVIRRGFPSTGKKSRPVSEPESSSLGFYFFGIGREKNINPILHHRSYNSDQELISPCV